MNDPKVVQAVHDAIVAAVEKLAGDMRVQNGEVLMGALVFIVATAAAANGGQIRAGFREEAMFMLDHFCSQVEDGELKVETLQ